MLVNIELGKELKTAHYKQNRKSGGKRRIRLPDQDSLEFEMFDEHTIAINVMPKSVLANMQKNEAAFEGWALAIRNWLPKEKYRKIILNWNKVLQNNLPTDNKHFQRFLYRAIKFDNLFEWFELQDRQTAIKLSRVFKDNCNGKIYNSNLYINGPNSEKTRNVVPQFDEFEKASEAALEGQILHQKILETMLDIKFQLHSRQLPVGLFGHEVSNDNAIFTGGKSAIDLFGIDNKMLYIFELKKAKTISVGIFSELFFYSQFYNDFINGNFQYKNEKLNNNLWQNFSEDTVNLDLKSIMAYFLATDLHPLLEPNEKGISVLDLVNKEMIVRGVNIQYNYLKLEPFAAKYEKI